MKKSVNTVVMEWVVAPKARLKWGVQMTLYIRPVAPERKKQVRTRFFLGF
jgi:hypothetical protein